MDDAEEEATGAGEGAGTGAGAGVDTGVDEVDGVEAKEEEGVPLPSVSIVNNGAPTLTFSCTFA